MKLRPEWSGVASGAGKVTQRREIHLKAWATVGLQQRLCCGAVRTSIPTTVRSHQPVALYRTHSVLQATKGQS